MTNKEKKNMVNYQKFLEYSRQKKSIGWDSKEIAKSLGMNTREFKDLRKKAKDLEKRKNSNITNREERNQNESRN